MNKKVSIKELFAPPNSMLKQINEKTYDLLSVEQEDKTKIFETFNALPSIQQEEACKSPDFGCSNGVGTSKESNRVKDVTKF